MRIATLSALSAIAAALLTSASLPALAAGAPAAAGPAPALSGTVSSAKEGAMEGVLVTAKRDGSNMSLTVVSDAKGHYAFPADRLSPGHYGIKIRAIGYYLSGPKTVDVTAAGSTADIKLNLTDNIAPQLTNSDWLRSMPGTPDEKRDLVNCATCHTLQRPLNSVYTADQLQSDVFPRMALMASQAFPDLVQKRVIQRDTARNFGGVNRLATYIASVNLSTAPEWKFPLKYDGRLKGESTHVIITSYDMPERTMQPHDAVRDDQGYVWISDFGENKLNRLDPKTGEFKTYSYSATRPGYSNGNLDVEFDKDGYLWLSMMNQTGAARFDRKTGTFKFYTLPKEMMDDESQQAMVAPVHSNVDGKVWVNYAEHPMVTRFDVATGKFDAWHYPFKDQPKGQQHGAYGVYTDSQNNAYLLDFPSEYIWKVDAKTGASTAYKTPSDYSRPRRGRMDDQDRLWFAEWRGDKVAMFDTKSGTFKEWTVPGYDPAPYDAQIDKTGWVWTDNMMDDRVTRIDTKTGHTIQYLMPIETNARRISVDNSGPTPALWIGANHQAVVMKIEPLE